MKRLLKNLIASNIILAFLVSLLLVSATDGSFSDTEVASGNSFTVSTLDFSLHDVAGAPLTSLFSLTNVKPSETNSATVYIHKDGQLDFAYNLQAIKTGGDDSLCSALNIRAQKDGTTLYNGSLLGLTLPTAVSFSGTDEDWDFDVSFSNAAPSLEKKSCAFDVVIRGWQVESDGVWGFADEERVTNSISTGDWTAPIVRSGFLGSYKTNASFSVPYSGSDSSSDITTVDLYASYEHGAYTKIATQTPSPAGLNVSGSFAITLTSGDGLYEFYTIATDAAGNVQSTPTSADSLTWLDSTPPVSSAGALPAITSVAPITIPYTVSDVTAGLSSISLYMKYNNTGSYASVVTQSISGKTWSGNFSYTLNSGDGLYEFYTRATDVLGSIETAPVNRDSFTTLTTEIIRSEVDPNNTMTTYYRSDPILIPFVASDTSYGINWVKLYYRYNGGAYNQYGVPKNYNNHPTNINDVFNFSFDNGDGLYEFYTIAHDEHGNTESVPTAADQSTIYDENRPTSSAGPLGDYTNQTIITVPFTASDAGTGVEKVNLFWRYPGGSSYRNYDTIDGLSGNNVSGNFAVNLDKGVGEYRFYTIATDKIGRVESGSSADTSTTLDVTPPTISSIQVTNITESTVTITWTTSEPSTSQVEYGLNTSYGNLTTLDSSYVTSHSITVTGLSELTLYHFRVNSIDQAGNEAMSGNNTFTTLRTILSGDVVINELMWMGSYGNESDEYDEWIELRNMTAYPISISNWTITYYDDSAHPDRNMNINLSGKTIPANGYFLISNNERNDSEIAVTPDVVDNSVELSNTNLQVKLYKGSINPANLIDTAGNINAPLAGEITTNSQHRHFSMERNNIPGDGAVATNWHTCSDYSDTERSYWDNDDEYYNRGTPGGPNLSENDLTSPDYNPGYIAENEMSAVAVIPDEPQEENNKEVKESTPPAYKKENNETDSELKIAEEPVSE